MGHDIEKAMAKLASTKKKMAEGSVFNVIGEHVFSLVERDDDVSLASILVSLQHQIDGSPSNAGQGDPAQDLERLSAEVALESLKTRKLPPSPLIRRRAKAK